MSKRSDWQEFKAILDQHRITKLYHFTDRDNLENIIRHGGLYSWADCEEKVSRYPSQAVATYQGSLTSAMVCSTMSVLVSRPSTP